MEIPTRDGHVMDTVPIVKVPIKDNNSIWFQTKKCNGGTLTVKYLIHRTTLKARPVFFYCFSQVFLGPWYEVL